MILGLILIFTSFVHSYTLNNNFGANFKQNDVKVYFADTTTCINAQIQVGEFQSLIEDAIDKFWNTVPTSRLRLKYGGPQAISPLINSARLCSYTDADCTGAVVPAVSDIVIACNTNTADNFPQGSVLALALPNNFKSRHINGSVILINETTDAFGKLSYGEKVSVLAHEIGHAIGLGHSDDPAALMYYKAIGKRNYLGQDDFDGVSALYPVQFDGCGLFGNTVSTNHPTNFLTSLLMGFILIILMTFLKNLFHIGRTFLRRFEVF